MQFPHSLSIRAVLFASIALSAAITVHAQTAPAPEREEVVTLDRYEVTGSNLALPAGAVPLASVTAADIASAGVATNLLEVLRKQLPAFSGSSNIGLNNASTTNTNTYGGSRLSLHNTGTLVLLNGRRVATNGANARNGSSFVDVSMFPLSSIARVDVLTNGASAVYGSDALGGVVNVILKPSYNGSEVGGRYAFSTSEGDYSERSAYFVTGAQSGRWGVIVTGEYSKSTPLFQDERPFGSPALTSSFSGVVGSGSSAYLLNTSVNSPRDLVVTGPSATAANMAALEANGTYIRGASSLDLAPDVTLYGGREQFSTYTGLTLKLIDRKLEAFGDVLYSRANSFVQLGAQVVTFGGGGTNPPAVPDNSPYNPINGNVSSVAFRYLPAPRQYTTTADQLRFTVGLKGEISSDWNWETAYVNSNSRLVSRIKNVLYGPNLSRAVAGGYDASGNAVSGGAYSLVRANYNEAGDLVLQAALDPFARPAGINSSALANVLGTSRADFESTLDSADLVVRGTPLRLPSGSIMIAAGGDYRTEQLEGVPDENSRNTGPTAQRWSGGTFFDPFNKSRYVRSVFGEVRIPVTGPQWNVVGAHAIDLTAAYRLEDYSDAGESRVPRYGVRWQPIDNQLTLRYTYSEGFSAPTLYALFGPVTRGLSANLSSSLGYTDGVSRQGTKETGANAKLKATDSTTHSVGFTAEPKILRGLSLSVDYHDMRLEDLISSVGDTTISQSVNQLGTASPYASQVTLNGAAITSAGQIRAFLDGGGLPAQIFISDTSRNLQGAILRYVDLSANYKLPTKSAGEFSLGTVCTFFLDDKIQALPSESYYEYAGLATSREGTMPGYRVYTHLNWRKAGWEVVLGNTYIPPVDDLGPGGVAFATSTTLKRTRIYSYMAWDLGVARTFELSKNHMLVPDKLTLRLGVNNLTDELAPAAPQAFPTTSAGGADVGTYGAVGRLFYVSAEAKF
jgi:iron complex outermembrane receptor protein